jgi:hypothetical protein
MNGELAPPHLRESSERFSAFLRQNGYSEDVVWVDEEDVVWDGRVLSIRAHQDDFMWDRACHRYAEAIRGGFGVALSAFSQADGTTIAAIVWPLNDEQAQCHLFPAGGIKLSVATTKLRARFVRNRFSWGFLSTRYRAASRSFKAEYLRCS